MIITAMKLMRKVALLMLVMSVALVTNAEAFTLRDAVLWQGKKGIGSVTPSADGVSYYTLRGGSKVLKVDFKTGSESVVFDAATARDCDVKHFSGFEMSEDESKILLYTNEEMIYRYSFRADHYVYEIRHNKVTKLSDEGQEEIATFSPDGRMVAFVYQNNIYIKKLDYGSVVPVTKDGKANEIINGVPDWVYQEEFGLLSSLAWSPDNLTLSFVRWDESHVPMYSMQMYHGACNPIEENRLYPGAYNYKYPKAGCENSKVSVLSYDVENRTLKTMNVPMVDDDYIPKIVYGKTSDRLMVTKLNRHQNEISLYAVNPRSTVAKLIYSEKSKSWIDYSLVTEAVYYDNFFIIRSEKSGWTHLYQYSNSGALMKQLTNGNWNVTDYYGYNPTTKTFYFQSTQVSPLDRTIAKIDAKGVVTPIVDGAGTYSAIFSTNMAYYIQNFSNATTPNQYRVINTLNGKEVRTLELNEEYAAKYTANDVPKREFFKLQSDGYMLDGYMIKPLDFDASKKYPVIMSQYSGPGSQQVKNSWKLDWEEYFATQGYIVVCVDGRGTGFRGKEFESAVYMRLGYYETIDQIAAAKYMAKRPYVDGNKIGIWGWSFGGYEVLMAMSQLDSPYAAGVAIAPVTDWRFYDTIYAERFMRTPNENESGYDEGSPLKRVRQQKGNLLIMAGTADDNVHITNTYQYAAEMTQQGKLLDMMVYLNMNHSINGCETRLPLYNKVLDFFNKNLK